MLANVAKQNRSRTQEYAGKHAANELSKIADKLGEAPARPRHADPFIRWIEQERLTLAPAVELVDPALEKLDWLVLPDILERNPGREAVTPPPLFAMFNTLKADFILARDLAWRANKDTEWPETGIFADTLDFAIYGPGTSAHILAHRTAIALLDKIGVTANHHFKMGHEPSKVFFGRIWRQTGSAKISPPPLVSVVERAIQRETEALYGLIELSEDCNDKGGILRSHKDLRNAGTHRFVVLHDLGTPTFRPAAEIEHHQHEQFAEEVTRALRVARSALQLLALAIRQHEHSLLNAEDGPVGVMPVPDHDWVRGRREEPE